MRYVVGQFHFINNEEKVSPERILELAARFNQLDEEVV